MWNSYRSKSSTYRMPSGVSAAASASPMRNSCSFSTMVSGRGPLAAGAGRGAGFATRAYPGGNDFFMFEARGPSSVVFMSSRSRSTPALCWLSFSSASSAWYACSCCAEASAYAALVSQPRRSAGVASLPGGGPARCRSSCTAWENTGMSFSSAARRALASMYAQYLVCARLEPRSLKYFSQYAWRTSAHASVSDMPRRTLLWTCASMLSQWYCHRPRFSNWCMMYRWRRSRIMNCLSTV